MKKTLLNLLMAVYAMCACALSANAKDYKRQDPEIGGQYYIYCPASQKFLTVTDANAENPESGVSPMLSATDTPTTLWTIGETKDAYSLSITLSGSTLYLNYGDFELNTYVLKFSANTWDLDIRSMNDSYYTISNYVNNDGYLKIGTQVGNDKSVSDESKFIFVSANLEEVLTLTLDENATSSETSAAVNRVRNAKTNVTVKRTMSTGKWNSLCLPFGMTEAEVIANFGKGTSIKKLTGISDGVVNFENATTIDACGNYIVNPANDITKIEVEDKDNIQKKYYFGNYLACERPSWPTYLVQAPGYRIEKIDCNGYPTYILSNSMFYLVDSDVTCKAFRWYIKDNSGSSIKKLTIKIDDEETAIDAIADLAPAKDGKYLDNGKLYIQKSGVKYNVMGIRK